MAGKPNYVKIEIAAFKRQMAPLIGGVIVEANAEYVDGEVWPLLVIEKCGKNYVLQPLRDAEHNGPGAVIFNEM